MNEVRLPDQALESRNFPADTVLLCNTNCRRRCNPLTTAIMNIFIDIAKAIGELAEALNRNPFGAVMLAVLACIGIAAVKVVGLV